MSMKLENFISGALYNPSDYVSYHVSRKLAELYPEKAIIEGSNGGFTLEPFVKAGLCSAVQREDVHNPKSAVWRRFGIEIGYDIENAVLNVLWQDHVLDLVLLTWTDDGCKTRRHWIIADTQEIAEEFFYSVCKWCSERSEEHTSELQ